MEKLKRWETATKVVTIRLSEEEYNALEEEAQRITMRRGYKKKTKSDLARDMIRYCLNNEIKNL